VSTDRHTAHKALLAPLRAAMYDFGEMAVRAELERLLSPACDVRMCHPLGDISGAQAFYDVAYKPLFAALPDLERRDTIVIAGQTADGQDWVGCCGHYTGVFAAPWLDIPATGHQVAMRFHEFYRFDAGQIAEVQAIWDIPEMMMQASAWPMAPSLGREWHVPGPATQDGLVPGPCARGQSNRTRQRVIEMLTAMKRHPAEGGPAIMELERYWHPRMTWYGPSGIGTGRGIAGFRNWHQIPYLNAMPDRGQHPEQTCAHFFADRSYAAVTGWPNMMQTLTGDGWMGLAPTGTRLSMRSLDFWRLEGDLIRENWVMVDLLDTYRQIGVDVLARLREFNKARSGFSRETGRPL